MTEHVDPRIEAAAKAIAEHNGYRHAGLSLADKKFYAESAIAALAAADKAATITTVEELDALPVGSMIRCHWENGSYPDQTIIRCDPNSGGSAGGFSLMADKHWRNVIGWGASMTVIHWGTE